MADIPRLNSVIKALETGKPAFTCFSPTEVNSAINLSGSKYDGVVFEMEHNGYDIRAFRDALQYMLNRRQLVQGASLAPAVAPLVRIPPNGCEKAQWHAKQVLDIGAYGPHPAKRRREAAVAAKAGPRHRRLGGRVPAHIKRGQTL